MTILLRQKPLPQVVRQIVQRGNGAWFDTEDMSTMFQDAAGTTPVTALEQPVGKWLDKSGNGNHATQPITASRPTLSARYNLLTKTEDFADAAWVKQGCVAVSNAAMSPLRDMTASLITNTASGGYFSQIDSLVATTKTLKVSLSASSTGWCRVVIASLAAGSNSAGVYVNTNTGDKGATHISGTGYSLVSATSTKNADGWVDVVITVIGPSEVMRPVISTAASNGNNIAPVGATIYVWGAHQTVGSTPLPYQRVNTATDYDSEGWPRYLKGDGIDDFFNLPFMNLYGNGVCSIVAARDAVSQATDTYIISERSTTDVDPKYFPSRQLASGGNMDSYIVSDEGTVRLDTTGSAFGGAKPAAIRSVIDSGSNIKLFKDGAVVADDNYTRAGTLTLNNTTLSASVSTTTSNYAKMQLYGVIITKSALSDTDRKRCEQYQARKLSKLGVTLA